tara:strand:+ start:3318 stop:3935 length:618 start_codon:yes stop_codon:yes gene_type:complete
MALSKIDICNQALVLIGANTIASFNDNTTESAVSNQLYESTLRQQLTRARWRFASKQAVLSKSTTDPLDRYDSSYAIPNDAILIHTCTVSDSVITYDRYGDFIFTNTSTSDTVVCDYTFQPHENDLPPYFSQIIIFELASLFAGAIARNDQLSVLYQRRAIEQLRVARATESQTQTTRKLKSSLLIEVRHRGAVNGITAVVPTSS